MRLNVYTCILAHVCFLSLSYVCSISDSAGGGGSCARMCACVWAPTAASDCCSFQTGTAVTDNHSDSERISSPVNIRLKMWTWCTAGLARVKEKTERCSLGLHRVCFAHCITDIWISHYWEATRLLTLPKFHPDVRTSTPYALPTSPFWAVPMQCGDQSARPDTAAGAHAEQQREAGPVSAAASSTRQQQQRRREAIVQYQLSSGPSFHPCVC